VHTVFVANRRYDRAIGLAQRFGGSAVRFEDLPAELARADIVVSCTSSPHQIFGREELEVVLELRGRRPLVLIDIAVPRDIEPSVRDLCSGVTLFDMDDLQAEVDRSLSVLEEETDKARALVDEETERFERWLETLDVVPTISALRELGERIVEQVLRENEARWESLSEADRDRLGVMARAVVNRLLHEPTLRLKDAAGEDSFIQLNAVRELFGLEAGAPGETPGAEVADLDARRRRRR
jgi:glutamyl-tRNA reductase